MHHYVLDLREPLLERVVNTFRYIVSRAQVKRLVNAYFNVDVYLVAEYPGAQQVNAPNALDTRSTFAHFFLGLAVAGVIYHAVDSVLENVVCDLKDEKADYNAGYGFKDGEAQRRAADADKRAYGGQRVAPVVPCLSRKRGRVYPFGVDFCVPEHRLLDDYRGDSRDKRERIAEAQLRVRAREYALQRFDTYRAAREEQHDGEDYFSYALEPLVAVGVV